MKDKIVLGLLGLLTALVGANLFLTLSALGKIDTVASGGVEEVAEEVVNPFAETKYLKLDPNFTITLKPNPSRKKYLVVQINVATNDLLALDALNQHMPAIRNKLLVLLGNVDPEPLQAADGQEVLRASIQGAIEEVMIERFGEPGITEALITDFKMQ